MSSVPTKCLGDVADVNWGNTTLTKASYSEGGFTAFSATGPDGFLPEYEHNCTGIVLSAIGAKCGKCFPADGKWTAIKNTITITPLEDRETDFRYLFYYLNREELWPRRGVGQPFIGLGDARKLCVPYPPFSEQKRIAEFLDRAETLRAKRRAALAQLDTLTQSIFLDLFGDPATNPKRWPIKSLNDLGTEFRYGTSNKSEATGRPTLRIPNVVGGEIDIADLKCVPVDDAEFARLRLLDGDILFVRTNGNPDFVGRCSIFETAKAAEFGFTGTEFIYASYLIRARINAKEITSEFLQRFLSTSAGKRQLRAGSKTSAGQFNINTESLGGLQIPIPPLKLQHEFARRAAAVEKLKTAHRQSLAELDALFASLQHRAFRGEL